MRGRSWQGGRFAVPLLFVVALGVVGAILVGWSAWYSGTRPPCEACVGLPTKPLGWWLDGVPVLRDMPLPPARLSPWLGRAGVFALLVAWFGLRRRSVDGGLSLRLVIVVVAAWTLPLLLSPPYASGDSYSYVANGRLAERGLDPGAHPPVELGDDQILWVIDPVWHDDLTPYGPASTFVSELTVRMTGDSIEAGVLLWRLWALGGVALLGVGVAALAREYGVDRADALVLAVAGPLTVVHLIGGIHNEAPMVGLLACGLAVAARGRGGMRALLVGAALCGLAAAFKAPAIAGAAYIGWTGGRPPLLGSGGRALVVPDRLVERGLRTVATIAVAVGTIAVVGLLAGAGWGWVDAARQDPGIVVILSLSTTVGLVLARLTGAPLVVESTVVRTTRSAFSVAGLVIAAVLLFFAPSLGPAGLAGALVVVALCAPNVQVWYFTWGLAPAAVALAGRRVWWPMVVVAIVLLAEGANLGLRPARLVLVTAGLVAGIAAWVWWSRRPTARPA
jgi:alpha-1,6-mannosyltransferase